MDYTSAMSSVRYPLTYEKLPLTVLFRISRSLRCGYPERRADQDDDCHQKDFEPILERKLRHVNTNFWHNGLSNADVVRRASEESILAVQIFDQKKFKKKDQGFLGVINVRVGDVVDFSSGQDRK